MNCSSTRFLSLKLCLFICAVALGVSLLFRQLERPWVAFRMGETAFARGDYAQAATLYEKATQKLDDPRILGALARCWLALGRSDDAMKVLIRMVEKYPDQLPAIRLLSGLYQRPPPPG